MATQEALPNMEAMAKRDETTPARLIELAVTQGANAEALGKLMDLQLRWEANEARKQFEQAFALFKRNAPKIEKTKLVSYANRGGDKTEYRHAELDKITEILGESLRAHGIVHQWKTSDENGRTTVACVLSGFGHTHEGSKLSGPPDTSGGKNNVQAIGSTVTYLQRYTLLTTCGLAATNADDDGKTEGLPETTIEEYCIALQDESDMTKLKATFKECWEKAKAVNDSSAQERFRKVYEGRKKAIAETRQ